MSDGVAIRVLTVDGEPFMAKLLELMLRQRVYTRVVTWNSAGQALSRAAPTRVASQA
jgi:hypothetical protein